MEDCPSYGDCRLPWWDCDAFCKFYGMTCKECVRRVGDECGLMGEEVSFDTPPCSRFLLDK